MKHTLIALAMMLSMPLWADTFNFGECSGSGTFKQQIHQFKDYEDVVTVGEIPAGIKGLHVELLSDNDVDIRLYGHKDDGTEDKIVHWPRGILNRSFLQSRPYESTNITYSGYNGVDDQKGHEYVEVNGTTPVPMTMKAFGYVAGFATVNYSWTGKVGCTSKETGTGHFVQDIEKEATTMVGTIPAGIHDVEITLDSSKDLDIQLYGADGTAIVSWKPTGLLAGATKQSIDYHGMHIIWSGYDGVGGKKGHEYIKITNMTKEVLTMKVYGYESGSADVDYTWGLGEDLAHKYGIARQGTVDSGYVYYQNPSKVLDDNDSTYNHTRNSSENWVEVAFPKNVEISNVKVKIGLTQFAYRLNGAKVYLIDTPYVDETTLKEDDVIGTLVTSSKAQWFHLDTPKSGKYIVVKAKGNNFLHIASIEAYGKIDTSIQDLEKIDLAKEYGTARQGTIDRGYVYYKAPRNVLDGNASTHNHTRNSKEQNWVEVALPKVANISKVKVKIGLTQFSYRLTGAHVYLRDVPYANGDELDDKDIIGTLANTSAEQWFEIDGRRQGKYIVVKGKYGDFLHIASISAYGMIDASVHDLETIDLAQDYGMATQGTVDSTYVYYKAPQNVLDGNASTYNHTRNSKEQNWVEVALPKAANISKVKVKIGLTQFSYRLTGAHVYLRDTPYANGDELDTKDIIGTLVNTSADQWFDLNGTRQGKYILVKGKYGDFLHIASISTYGIMAEGEEHFVEKSTIERIDYGVEVGKVIHTTQMKDSSKDYIYTIDNNTNFSIDSKGNISILKALDEDRTYVLNVTAYDGLVETSTKIIIAVGKNPNISNNLKEDYSSKYPIEKNVIGDLDGQAWFMQSHMHRLKPKEGEYRPSAVTYRTALFLFMMENPHAVSSVKIKVTNNKNEVFELNLDKPSDIPLPDQIEAGDDRPLLTFSKRSWTGEIPWNFMSPNMSIELTGYDSDGAEISSSTIPASEIVLGQPHEILLNNIDLGMLVEPKGSNRQVYASADNRAEFAINYFQTAPIAKYIVSRYAPAYFPKVVFPTGTVYTDKSADTKASAHGGDMRGHIAKALVSIGIDLANIGKASSPSDRDNYDRFIRQTLAHTARGRYTDPNDSTKSVVVAHGLSGGAGKLTLYSLAGNEFSHEIGHDFGLPHFPGGVLSIHNYLGGWSYDAYKKRFIGNLAWVSPAGNRSVNGEIVEPYNGVYSYLTDAMAGGSTGNSAISKFTYYTPYSGYKIQKNLESSGIIDDSSPTGYSQWNKELGKYEPKTVNYPKPTKSATKVMTLLGFYDPKNELETFIYPALYANYGSYFKPASLNAIDTDNTCHLDVRNSNNVLYSFNLSNRRFDLDKMNQFQVNLPLDEGPYSTAKIICNGNELDSREIAPLDFDLGEPIVVGKEHGIKQALPKMRTFAKRYDANQFLSVKDFEKTFNNDFQAVKKYNDNAIVKIGESYSVGTKYYLALENNAGVPSEANAKWLYLGDSSNYIDSSSNGDKIAKIGEVSENFSNVYGKSIHFYVPKQDNKVTASDTTPSGSWLKGGHNTIKVIAINKITGDRREITLIGSIGGYSMDSGRVINSGSSLNIRLDPDNNPKLPKGDYEISFYAYGVAWHDGSQKLKVLVQGTVGN